MTRRERLERKLEKRQEWAASRSQQATSRFNAARAATEGIPFGQPILVGHHSEKRHRAAIARSDANMSKAVECENMAQHHLEKASGLQSQLENTIFSDDPDAIESLEAKVAKLESERDEMKRLNSWWRKHGTMKGCPGITDEAAARIDADMPKRHSWEKQPFPSYSLTNIGGRIRQAKERIEQVKRRQDRTAKAEASGGVVIEGGEWVSVTFAEKPAREVLNALKEAGFRWGGGSWAGKRANLPACLTTANE